MSQHRIKKRHLDQGPSRRPEKKSRPLSAIDLSVVAEWGVLHCLSAEDLSSLAQTNHHFASEVRRLMWCPSEKHPVPVHAHSILYSSLPQSPDGRPFWLSIRPSLQSLRYVMSTHLIFYSHWRILDKTPVKTAALYCSRLRDLGRISFRWSIGHLRLLLSPWIQRTASVPKKYLTPVTSLQLESLTLCQKLLKHLTTHPNWPTMTVRCLKLHYMSSMKHSTPSWPASLESFELTRRSNAINLRFMIKSLAQHCPRLRALSWSCQSLSIRHEWKALAHLSHLQVCVLEDLQWSHLNHLTSSTMECLVLRCHHPTAITTDLRSALMGLPALKRLIVETIVKNKSHPTLLVPDGVEIVIVNGQVQRSSSKQERVFQVKPRMNSLAVLEWNWRQATQSL